MMHSILVPSVPITDEAPVSELMQKKLERIENLKKLKTEKCAEMRKINREKRKALFERCMAYEKEYFELDRALIKEPHKAAMEGKIYRAADPKVLFVIRLKGINKLAPKPKKILQLFRLRQLNNGVFLKNNKAIQEMLKVVHPFVAIGHLNVNTMRKLFYKRAYAKVGKPGAWSRKRILTNEVIQDNLGKYGIDGMEDLIHEIYTCGPHFKQANNFLWPFKLSTPRGGWVAKRRCFSDPRGGDWGDREHLMNHLLRKMM